MAEKEEDDGFEEMNGEKQSSAEFEGREPFPKAASQFQNGHGYEGVSGKGEYNEWRGQAEDRGDEDDDGNNYQEELTDDNKIKSTECSAEELSISVPFHGKIYVAPEYSNIHLPEERTKDASDAKESQQEEHFDNVESEPEGIEQKYQFQHSAKEDSEDEEDTSLFEEESDEGEDDVEQEKRMEVDEEAVQEEKQDEIDNLNPRLLRRIMTMKTTTIMRMSR